MHALSPRRSGFSRQHSARLAQTPKSTACHAQVASSTRAKSAARLVLEWQESVVSVRREDEAPLAAGSRIVVTRRVGRREVPMTSELTELSRPTSWAVRGTDGPVRGIARGTVELLGAGERSRVTISLDFEARGIGRLLLPLVVRRQARAEMPRNMRKLKERLETGA